MNILVTGAYGNIGRPVIDEILKRNHEITVFERKTNALLKHLKNIRILSKKQYSETLQITMMSNSLLREWMESFILRQ